MASRPRPSAGQLRTWQRKLERKAGQMRTLRGRSTQAELELRALIVDASAAGLTVTPIVVATGLSPGRVHQIRRGTRR